MISSQRVKTGITHTSSKAQAAVDRAAAKAKGAIRIGSRTLGTAVDKAEAKAGELKGRALRKKAAAKRKVGLKIKNAKAKIQEKKQRTESWVKQHPWKALGFAALAGFVTAKILRRRR